ncbi:AraC family transcriptional regulator [Amycolatopsis sp. PS_44_ISF1]|uniref:AraC family transcriptional regulator n=1 Tax=Amycolatopsis sp. PS_44_ISF1 TaxID=2974917 RepID=UPI0028DE94B9|nr:AraC family transcriptional regulator [Amycolatopsis sp. PS_44_ISF1]MDT8913615.1 AraC family transcriptional regulator [Amycolatopsis sp. PS_44_ISF1]
MDLLANAIAAARFGRPSSDRVHLTGSWCVQLDDYTGTAFLTVLTGTCWLLRDEGEPVALARGDVVLLTPRARRFVVASEYLDPAEARRRTVSFTSWRSAQPQAGAGPAPGSGVVDVLCGKYRLPAGRLPPLLADLPEVIHIDRASAEATELGAVIRLLELEQRPGQAGAAAALPGLLDLVLVYAMRWWTMGAGPQAAWTAALADPVTAAALTALHADPARPWTISRLAAAVGVSRPTLVRRFTAAVGHGPMGYLTWWRLVTASALLRHSNATLATVAQQVGYSSPYSFSHAFKRQFGTTPGRYRATARAADSAAARPPTRPD